MDDNAVDDNALMAEARALIQWVQTTLILRKIDLSNTGDMLLPRAIDNLLPRIEHWKPRGGIMIY